MIRRLGWPHGRPFCFLLNRLKSRLENPTQAMKQAPFSWRGRSVMSTFAESVGATRKPWQWIAVGGTILLIWAAVALPALNRSRPAHSIAQDVYAPQVSDFYAAPALKSEGVAAAPRAGASRAMAATESVGPG